MSNKPYTLVAMAAVLGFLFSLASANAQWASPSPDDLTVKVTAYDIRPVKYDDIFPNIEGFSTAGREFFLRILVEYNIELRPDRRSRYQDPANLWLDNLEFDWTVIVAPVSKGRIYNDRQAIRLSKTISYTNVQVGKRGKYYALVFVDPRVIQRYAGDRLNPDALMTRLAIRIDRKTQVEMAAKGKRFGTSNNERRALSAQGVRGDLFESEDIIRPTYGLLNRKESPWNWAANDSFETIVDTPSQP